MSKPVVGSSSSSIGASCAIARARTARRSSPPESESRRREAAHPRSRRSSAVATASRSRAPSLASGPRCGVRPSSTYCSTLKLSGIAGSCGTRATVRARSRRPRVSSGRPHIRTEPVWCTSPAIACTSVVLPAPFGPMMQSQPPVGTSSPTSDTIARLPSSTESPRTSRAVATPERASTLTQPSGSGEARRGRTARRRAR
jgi:hypothetical protein